MTETPNLGLSQWSLDDLIKMADFNSDNSKIDTAYGNLSALVANGAKITTGSYTGTGTYGASNPNSLTFDFEPKLVICGIATTGLKPDGTYWSNGFVWYFGTPIQYTGSGKIINMRVDGNTLSWYSTNDMTSQLNYSAQAYNYIAIG